VDVEVAPVEEPLVDADRLGVRADPRHRGERGLAHDVAETSGDRDLPASAHPRGLDEEDLAPHRGPSQADGDTAPVGPLRDFPEEANRAEELGDGLGRDEHLALLALDDLARHLPADVGDLALEIADSASRV
jgi:hypothetical protein